LTPPAWNPSSPPAPSPGLRRLAELIDKSNQRLTPSVHSAMTTSLMLAALLVRLIAADATGTWAVHLDPDFGGMQSDVTCTFKQDGRKLTGNCDDQVTFTGEADERRLKWIIKTGPTGNEFTATFSGEIDESNRKMTGGWQLSDRADHRGKFNAQKR
jgi:hypothetical protein